MALKMPVDLKAFTDLDLLQLHAAVLEELRTRGVCRTSNNPVADYTEWLVAKKLGLRLDGNSRTGFDGTAEDGLRYQIKGRRITPHNRSTQLSAIRNLAGRQFDFLLAVMFDADFSIMYAAKIPHDLVAKLARFQQHTNSHVFLFRRNVLQEPGVVDVTLQLGAV